MSNYITVSKLVKSNNLFWIYEVKEKQHFNIVISKVLTKLNLKDYRFNNNELVINKEYQSIVIDYFKTFNLFDIDKTKVDVLNSYLNELEVDYQV